MAFVNRCIFLPSSGGTGTWIVASAVTGYLTPAQAGAADATVYRYTAELRNASGAVTAWEVGTATYTVAGTTLTRTVILSSNANAVVNFATPPQVMLCVLAEDLYTPVTTAVTDLGTATLQYKDLHLASLGRVSWNSFNVYLLNNSSQTLSLVASTAVLFQLAPDLSVVGFFYADTTQAIVGTTPDLPFSIQTNGISRATFSSTMAALSVGLSTAKASFILQSTVTITGGGTGNVPTLTAGPVTGNPTKWLPYDDNGTTRYIPSW